MTTKTAEREYYNYGGRNIAYIDGGACYVRRGLNGRDYMMAHQWAERNEAHTIHRCPDDIEFEVPCESPITTMEQVFHNWDEYAIKQFPIAAKLARDMTRTIHDDCVRTAKHLKTDHVGSFDDCPECKAFTDKFRDWGVL